MLRSWKLGVVGLAAVIAVAGCGSSSKGSSSTTASPATTAPASTAVASTTSPPTNPASTTQPTAVATTTTTHATTPVVAVCTAGQLTASLGSPNGAAGTIFYQLALTDKSAATCFVQGYPGVSFVAGSDGHQVGAPARRVAGATPTVTLTQGQSAYALLGIAEAGNFSNCQQTPVLGLRVYPPDSTLALFVSHNDTGCANTSVVTLSMHPLAATPST